MNTELFAGSNVVANIGWTLLHSIWQIGSVAVGLFFALSLLRRSSAQVRYLISISALALSLILPAATFIKISARDDIHSLRSSRDAALLRGSGSELKNRSEPVPATVVEVGPVGETSSSDLISAWSEWLTAHVPDISPVVVLAWLLGVIFFSLRMVGGFHQLRRFRTIEVGDVDEEWSDIFSGLCNRVGLKRPVSILRSGLVETPIAIGMIKPVIIVPASLFLQITPRELETIIAHELIHIRRYDPVVNIAQCIVEALLFYHPGVWWISAQIRREREFAADSLVVSIFEDSHVTYARALANLEEIRLRANQQMPRYVTAANGGNLMTRIQRILNIRTEASLASFAWTAGLALLLTSAFLLALFSFSSSELVNAQDRTAGRKLAIGFVSIPPVDRTANPPKDSDATARLLIQKLKEHKVPAIGFLQGGMVSDGDKLFPVRANIARMWIEAGFEIGLGGFKHSWLYHTPVDEYIANIERNERVAKRLIGGSGLAPRYFSYPFLNTGKSVEDKAKVEAWLASRGYTSVKYTFDNQEWMYSYAYDMARNDNDLNTMKEIRDAYVDYMRRMFDHYEAYSIEMFGRDIPQTMVLTPSRLITDTADEFFAMTAKRGYKFVSLDEAQSDPAYGMKDDFTGEAGISWFERWTMAKGGQLRKEPEVGRSVQQLWADRQTAVTKK